MLDADLPRLPSWQDAAWAQTLAGLSLLVASASPDEQGTQVLAAGAQGYCHSYARRRLAQALEVISTGGIWMGRSWSAACCAWWPRKARTPATGMAAC